jgi:hypothetical protein
MEEMRADSCGGVLVVGKPLSSVGITKANR